MKHTDEVVLTFRDGRTMIATVVVDPVALAQGVGLRASRSKTKRSTLCAGAVVVTVRDNLALPSKMTLTGAERIMQQLGELPTRGKP